MDFVKRELKFFEDYHLKLKTFTESVSADLSAIENPFNNGAIALLWNLNEKVNILLGEHSKFSFKNDNCDILSDSYDTDFDDEQDFANIINIFCV